MSNARDMAGLSSVNDRLSEVGNSDGALSNRNMLLNGSFQVAQRGTSFTTGSSNMYTLDRWRSQGTYDTENLTIEQSTDAPDGFGDSLKITVSTAEGTADTNDYHMVTQKFEGQNLTQLNYGSSNASTMTCSFWVKSSIAQTYCVSLYQVNGDKHYSQAYMVNTANTWEYKTVSISGNTANAISFDNSGELEIGFMLGAGSYYSSGSSGLWGGVENFAVGANHTFMTTANATLQITGVQLEVGDQSTPFEHRSYGDELQRCKRFFEVTTLNDHTFSKYNSGSAYGNISWEVEKRSAPTVTFTGDWKAYGSGQGASSVVNLYAQHADTGSARLQIDSGSYSSYFVRQTTPSYGLIFADAEL